MILSHTQIEGIAVAVTEDFNQFFSGRRRMRPGIMSRLHRSTSLQGITLGWRYLSPNFPRTGASAE